MKALSKPMKTVLEVPLDPVTTEQSPNLPKMMLLRIGKGMYPIHYTGHILHKRTQ